MAKGRKTGGRKKGSKNKVGSPIKEICQQYGPMAVKQLVQFAFDRGVPHQVRMSAIREILDRGYGKATQPLTGEDGGPIEVEFTFALDNASRSEDHDD